MKLNEMPWTDEKYILVAANEPSRLLFWRLYYPDLLEASKAVCNNSISFRSFSS